MLFACTFSVLSSSLHHREPLPCYGICALGFLFVLGACGYSGHSVHRKIKNHPEHVPSWCTFFALTSLLAYVLGTICGEANFYVNLQPFFDIMTLDSYSAVDPRNTQGQRLMDAGRIVFSNGTWVDSEKSMRFKRTDEYCVAPITMGNTTLASYDFWAVGFDCCSGPAMTFRCNDMDNPRAHAGLRLMRDDQRPLFRLAVQQAEAAYKITAKHPLFFHWVLDPVAEATSYRSTAFKYLLIGILSHFTLQLTLVILATLCFSKLGHY